MEVFCGALSPSPPGQHRKQYVLHLTAEGGKHECILCTNSVISMQGAFMSGQPKILFKYRSPHDIRQHISGSDTDIGGSSTAKLDISPEDGRGRFSGVINMNVPKLKDGSTLGGDAGLRNRR